MIWGNVNTGGGNLKLDISWFALADILFLAALHIQSVQQNKDVSISLRSSYSTICSQVWLPNHFHKGTILRL